MTHRLCYSVAEAALASGYTEHQIRKHLRLGTLRAYRPAGVGDYRILTDDLLCWIRGDGMPAKERQFRGSAAQRVA